MDESRVIGLNMSEKREHILEMCKQADYVVNNLFTGDFDRIFDGVTLIFDHDDTRGKFINKYFSDVNHYTKIENKESTFFGVSNHGMLVHLYSTQDYFGGNSMAVDVAYLAASYRDETFEFYMYDPSLKIYRRLSEKEREQFSEKRMELLEHTFYYPPRGWKYTQETD